MKATPSVTNVTPNTLFTGDCLYVLNGMNSESVDLIYLDPPFNSKRFYSAPVGSKAAGASFKDMWSWEDVDETYLERMIDDYPYLVQFIQSVRVIHGKAMMSYITYMTQRIIELHRVLKPTGSLYLHCDPTASHYLKIVLDRIFGKSNFRNEVIWLYEGRELRKVSYNSKHDVLLFYSKGKQMTFNWEEIGLPLKETSKRAMSRFMDSNGRPYVLRYKKGGGFAPKSMEKNINVYRQYVPQAIPPRDWVQIDYARKDERTGYPTQKPLALLERIIKASSNEGDTVLDPFCGCATTCVAAQQLNRKWIGIDVEKKSAELVVDRLSDDAGLFSDFIHLTEPPKRTDVEITDIVDPKNKKQVKEKLGKEYGSVCNACSMDDYKNLEIDHIVPKSKGGQDTYGNYQLLCGNCNRRKGNSTMEHLRAKIAKCEQHMKYEITFGA